MRFVNRAVKVSRFGVAALAASVLWLATCSTPDTTNPNAASTSPTSAGSGAAAGPDILDGSRPGGTIGFYFLPPISKRLREYPGTFDSALAPTVEICEWVANSCGSVVARMTMDGTTDGTITVDTRRERYRTKWKFDVGALGPNKTFRIQVLLEDQVIGYADARTGNAHDGDHHERKGERSDASTVSADADNEDDDTVAEHEDAESEIIRLDDMHKLWIRFRLEESLRLAGMIGPPGGTVTSRDGLITLTFPPNAVSKFTPITIARMNWPGSTGSPSAYDLGPAGMPFALPVGVSMVVKPALLAAAGAGAVPLIVTHAAPADTNWTVLPSGAFDPVAGRVTAQLTSFATVGYVFIVPANVNCARIIGGTSGPASTLDCFPPPLTPKDTVFVPTAGSVGSGLFADVTASFPSPGGLLWVAGVLPSCDDSFGQGLVACLPGLSSVSSRPDIAVRDIGGSVRGLKAGDAVLTASFSTVSKGSTLVRVSKGVASATHLFSFINSSNDDVGGSRGVLRGGATITGGRLTLDGSSGFAELDSRVVGDTGSFSVAFFAQQTSNGSTFVEFLSQGVSGSGFYVGHTPTGLLRASDTWSSTGVPMPQDYLEHHYAVTFNARTNLISLYVDGQMKATRSSPIARGTSGGNNTRFGRQFDPFLEYLPGALDNVSVYPSELSAVDVQTLARRTADLSCSVESTMKSGIGNTSTVVFENQSGEAVRVDWIDYSGHRVLYFGSLANGAGFVQQTFLTHPWIVTGVTSGKCYGIWLPVSTGRTIEVR